MEVFIGKQPILNKFEQTVAYELLYRSKNFNEFPQIDQDQATIDVITNAFLTFGLQNISDNKPVFINFSEKLLMNDFMFQLDPTNIVIEVLETVTINDQLIARLRELKNLGFKIALDDFEFDQNNKYLPEVFSLIDIIKVDFLFGDKEKRARLENLVNNYFPFISLLAEKVETREQYEEAIEAGYKLFQGYFFEQPKVLVSKDIEPNTLHYFEIMAILKSEEPDIDLISETIERDVSLTYKLLKLVNTTNNRIRSSITSIRQATMILGLIELQKWIYLLAIRSQHSTQTNNELIYISLFRSKICEMIARKKGFRNFSEYYLVGMFSNIDAILQIPMEEIVKDLPFSEIVLQTISGEETEMTPFLNLAVALQKFDLDIVKRLAADLDIPIDTLDQLYADTEKWVQEIMNQNFDEL